MSEAGLLLGPRERADHVGRGVAIPRSRAVSGKKQIARLGAAGVYKDSVVISRPAGVLDLAPAVLALGHAPEPLLAVPGLGVALDVPAEEP